MKSALRFLFIVLLLSPTLLYAQQAPKANFSTTFTSVCDTPHPVPFQDLSSGPPTSWVWYFPGAIPNTSTAWDPTVTYTQFGYHSVKLVVRNNFGSDSLTKNNYIFVDSMPHIKFIGSDSLCYGSRVTIDVLGGSIYNWSNGASTSTIQLTGIISHTYTVQVGDGVCFKDTSISVYVDSSTQITFKGNTTLCLGDSTIIYPYPRSSFYHYLWNTGSTADSIKVTGKKTGTYTYYLSVQHDSCLQDSLPVIIYVYNCTGIENYHNSSGLIVVYPNPGNGMFTFQANSQQLLANGRIEIYNMLGEKVYSQLTIDNSQFTINLSGQPDGIYLYRVITEIGKLIGTGKLFIQK